MSSSSTRGSPLVGRRDDMSTLALQQHSDSDESEHSYAGSILPSRRDSTICEWRTPRFHNQECERYFDCPTHIVERSLSTDGEDEQPGPASRAQEPSEFSPGANSSHQVTSLSHNNDSTTENLFHTNVVSHPLADDSEDDQARATEILTSETTSPPQQLAPPRTSSLPELQQNANLPIPSNIRTPTQRRNVDEISLFPQSSHQSVPTPPAAPPSFTRQEDLIANFSSASGENRSRPSSFPEQRPPVPVRRANEELPISPQEVMLPRWQPDNDTTFCPICRTQFSIFVRKHHCRKCGRVVCNSCSPHRIVIPYQFIVQPPGQPRRYPSTNGHRSLGGGERVRLCNPCVPDPNTAPPQGHGASTYTPRSSSRHFRSQSNASQNYPSLSGPLPPGRIPPSFSNRNRSMTMASTHYPGHVGYGSHHQRSQENRILSGTPPAHRSAYLDLSEFETLSRQSQASPSSSAAGPSQYHQIPEEDECPVCHRELPSRSLPGFETLRESHVMMCIQSHSQYGGVGSTSESPTSPVTGSIPSSSGSGMRRATGMFPYKATEKDCVDSAECTICLEEFEVGVPMARLECLCRFHKSCILAWWRKHPGRCPVHQHDAFGF